MPVDPDVPRWQEALHRAYTAGHHAEAGPGQAARLLAAYTLLAAAEDLLRASGQVQPGLVTDPRDPWHH